MVDIDEDGHVDVVFSNDEEYGVYLFESPLKGWTRKVMAGKAGEPGALPKIVRDGTNNGFFVHSRSLWWQNEDTARLPNLVDRRTFNDLLKDVEPRGKSSEASLRSIRVEPGFTGRTGRDRAVGEGPDRVRLGRRWPALGRSRWGIIPLGADGQGKARRRGPDTRRYEWRRPVRQVDDVPRRARLPFRHHAVANGVLVACAPDIFYAEDRDGDGKADHREVLFTGFTEGNQQHRINGFEIGLDGWVYGANGDSGGNVRSLKTGKTVFDQRPRLPLPPGYR